MSADEKKYILVSERKHVTNKNFFPLKLKKKRNLQVRSELKVSKKMRVNRFNDK